MTHVLQGPKSSHRCSSEAARQGVLAGRWKRTGKENLEPKPQESDGTEEEEGGAEEEGEVLEGRLHKEAMVWSPFEEKDKDHLECLGGPQ